MTAATRGGGAVLGQRKAARAVATIVVVGALLGRRLPDRPRGHPSGAGAGHRGAAHRRAPHRRRRAAALRARRGRRTRSGRRSCPSTSATTASSDLEPEETASVTFTGTGLGTTLTNTDLVLPRAGRAVGDVYDDLLEDCEQAVVERRGHAVHAPSRSTSACCPTTPSPLVVVVEHDDGTIEERNLIVMRSGDLVSTIRLDGPAAHRPRGCSTRVTRVAIGNLGLLDQAT